MAAYQPGLNKKISSIFDGVPIPKDDTSDDKSATKLPDFITDQVETAPLPPQQKPQPPQQQYFPSPEPQKIIQKPVEKTAPAVPGKVKTIVEPKTSFSASLKNIKAKLLGSKHGTSSPRQKVMIVAIPILVIVLIFVFVKVLKPSKPRRRIEPQTPQTQSQSTPSGTINWEIPKPLAGFFRDPMRFDSSGSFSAGSSLADLPAVGSEVIIRGIVHSEEKPTAVIGGHIVHEGDVISDVIILKINKDSIDLEKAGQKRTLKVGDTWPSFDETEQLNSDK
jgi:hypothetical protein